MRRRILWKKYLLLLSYMRMWLAEKNFKTFVCVFAWLWCKYFSQKTSLSRCALGSRAQNRQKPISKLFVSFSWRTRCHDDGDGRHRARAPYHHIAAMRPPARCALCPWTIYFLQFLVFISQKRYVKMHTQCAPRTSVLYHCTTYTIRERPFSPYKYKKETNCINPKCNNFKVVRCGENLFDILKVKLRWIACFHQSWAKFVLSKTKYRYMI